LSYTYFPTGKVETIASSNPGGASVSYTYDELNRLSTVVDNRLQGGEGREKPTLLRIGSRGTRPDRWAR